MGVIELVGKKTKHFFRVKIFKIKAIGRGGAGTNQQRQKVLNDFNGQIAEIFSTAPEKGPPAACVSRRLPSDTWVPLLARQVLEVLGSTTRLLVMMPASLSLAMAFSWLRDSVLWQSCM